MSARIVASSVAVLAALVLVAPLSAASDRGPNVSFSSAPRHVFPGKAASVTVSARPAGAHVLPQAPLRRRLVPAAAPRAGDAREGHVALAGGAVGQAGRRVDDRDVRPRAQDARAGRRRQHHPAAHLGRAARLDGPPGTLARHGRHLRRRAPERVPGPRGRRTSPCSSTSWTHENRLFGSATSRVPFVAAGSKFGLGDFLSFPSTAPIAKLEVVIQVGGWTRQAAAPVSVANLRVFEAENDVGWGGSLEGELINDHPLLILQRASLSAVIFDIEGNVIGGAQGSVSASLPPGGRVFFKLTSGLRQVPYDRAHSVLVSIEARYVQPGS